MFDYYEPSTQLNCLKCGAVLDRWQGKDGPNELLLWRQGQAEPAGFLVDDEITKLGATEEGNPARLPEAFELHTCCECCNDRVTSIGRCRNGVWVSSDRPVLDRVSPQ